MESNNSLNERNHQTINLDTSYQTALSLGENDETIWLAISSSMYILYFQYDLTNFSLIGNKYISSETISNNGLKMEVSEGIV